MGEDLVPDVGVLNKVDADVDTSLLLDVGVELVVDAELDEEL